MPLSFRFRQSGGVAVAASLFVAACGDSPSLVDLATDVDAAGRSSVTVEPLAPTDGATLSGQTLFRARAAGAYSVRWQVDGGQLNEMAPSADDSGHEAPVDVSGWSWRGNGPYTVNFRAFDKKGHRVGDAEVRIWIGQAGVVDTVAVVAPAAGARLSGKSLFQARVPTRSAGTYAMRWLVDGGQENAMELSADGTGHEALVDLSGWNWRGEGPYALTFRAYDVGGARIDEASVEIWIGSDDGTLPDSTATDTTSTGGTVGNALAGATFWVDPYSSARKTADAWYATRPDDAAVLERLAGGSQADWFGDWTSDVRSAVASRAAQIRGVGAVPVFVAYDIPLRDCNSYSGGGAKSGEAYRAWIRAFAEGVGRGPAAVILEPDALAQLDCLGSAGQQERLALLRDAVTVLKTTTDAAVYLDAGHPRWHAAAVTAQRLEAAGVAAANGFSLNVSNFVGDAENMAYGEVVSDLLGGSAHFVVDASRNGAGPAADGAWCNPDGRALGRRPTADTGYARVDAFLWIKRPGESDGTCNGGPRAGAWWAEYALGLSRRAPTSAVVAEE